MSSPLLSSEILDALKGYASNLDRSVTMVLQIGEHPKRQELVDFLEGIASVSDLLQLEQRNLDGLLRGPLSFLLESHGRDTGIRFSGIPSGHEFNSLVLAILQSGGGDLKLGEDVERAISSIDKPLDFKTFISLSCHNCPDVVQTLNKFCLLNEKLTNEMVDGALFPELVERYDVQSVPLVFLDEVLFAGGKISVANLTEKIQAMGDMPVEPRTELPTQDVTVVGGGPAGISAAIYAVRKGLKVTLICEELGGQVKETLGIENFISMNYTTGDKLTRSMTEHLTSYGVTLRENSRVAQIEQGQLKSVVLASGEIVETRSVVIASGAKWRELGVPGEKENLGTGVAYCPHCDGPFYKDKAVAVVGGGNSGIEASIDLAGIASTVKVFEFLPELKADEILVQRARELSNVTIETNVAVQSILSESGKVSAIRYLDRQTDEEKDYPVSGIFVQIGLLPNSQFLGDLVEVNDYGEIEVDAAGRTSQEGIFACGDVTNVAYKQIVIAMGEGAKAALTASEYLMLQSERELPTAEMLSQTS